MNFTNSPYEPFMKQPTYHLPPEPTPAPKGVPYWRGLRCVTCFRAYLRSRASPDNGR